MCNGGQTAKTIMKIVFFSFCYPFLPNLNDNLTVTINVKALVRIQIRLGAEWIKWQYLPTRWLAHRINQVYDQKPEIHALHCPNWGRNVLLKHVTQIHNISLLFTKLFWWIKIYTEYEISRYMFCTIYRCMYKRIWPWWRFQWLNHIFIHQQFTNYTKTKHIQIKIAYIIFKHGECY